MKKPRKIYNISVYFGLEIQIQKVCMPVYNV